MDPFYRQLAEFARMGEPVAAATVIAARGSTPREVGAKMIVRQGGAIVGSVGGGCGEAHVFWEAVRVLEDGRPRICEVDLTGEMNDTSLTHCGGVMEVFVDCCRWERTPAVGLSDRDAVQAIRGAALERRALALLTVVANPAGAAGVVPGSKWLGREDGTILGVLPAEIGPVLGEAAAAALESDRSHRLWVRESALGWERAGENEGLGLFVEVLAPPPELIVVGAGHIALPLVRMAKLLDFEVTVLDDRAAFASRERFPEADTVLVGSVAEVLRQRSIAASTYVVLVTRGHQHDEAALKAVIGSDAAYIGMIGSRRRVKEVFRHLASTGVEEPRIARVHAPIGLDIGAETPAEIAVAIAAELVQVRREALARHGRRPCASR